MSIDGDGAKTVWWGKKPWQNNDVGICSGEEFDLLRGKAWQIMELRVDVGETGFFRYYIELATILLGQSHHLLKS